MTRVKVGVRARPLITTEIEAGDEVILDVVGNSVILKNEVVGCSRDWEHRGKGRHFTYDYCFWSVDPRHTRYDSQSQIYQAIGVPVVKSLLEGYNGCVFAYGQSGSGKSYTVTGSQDTLSEEGLLPRLCSDVFLKLQDLSKVSSSVVEVSFIELYKERVRDLLNFSEFSENLRVREHPQQGPFVEGLTHHPVTCVDDVLQLVSTTRKHNLYKESSKRSHSIFTIKCQQEASHSETKRVLNSELHLVDLAGSERSTISGDTRDYQEIININKSLVTLGIVISSLANQSNASLRHYYVPFRNSVLTWLLKETLGGNCVTCMIATVSPASSCYKETLSTLRYAERAGNILNKPVVNESSETEHNLVSEMKSEKDLAKQRLVTSFFKQGIMFEKILSPYHTVSFASPKSKDEFNPFINKDYFEKTPAETQPAPVLLNSSISKPLSDGQPGLCNADIQALIAADLASVGREEVKDARMVIPESPAPIAFNFKPRARTVISKSCENIACEVVPLWKRFSRSLQDRERLELKQMTTKGREEILAQRLAPLPLSLLKMFKKTDQELPDVAEKVTDVEGSILSDRDDRIQKLIDTEFHGSMDMENFRMIEEETDSMLGSWCSSETDTNVMVEEPSDHQLTEVEDIVCAREDPFDGNSDEPTTPVDVIQRTVLDNCIHGTAVEVVPSFNRSNRLSDSVCSSVTGESDAYNDSLNTSTNTPFEEPGRTEYVQPNHSTPRRPSNYSTDSVEGHNNVTSCESLSYEEVEKTRRTYINYVTTASPPVQFGTVTDERKLPLVLTRDPGTPDSGFVSTRVFPGLRPAWPASNGPREMSRESSSSSDSFTYVFVDQALSKNSRNNSEERSSAESTTAPEANSVIEIPRVTSQRSNGESIVTLDSLEVWKEEEDKKFPSSPRTLSVDSLIMEQYLKMVNTTCPENRDEARGQSVRRKCPSRKSSSVTPKSSTTTTTSESSVESRVKTSTQLEQPGNRYDSDLVKLMSDVVQLLKTSKSGQSTEKESCHNCAKRVPGFGACTSSEGSSEISYRRRCTTRRSTNHSSSCGSSKTGSSTLEDDEYRRLMKDSLKKEIRLIRRERDQVYRLLQQEKRKNSRHLADDDNVARPKNGEPPSPEVTGMASFATTSGWKEGRKTKSDFSSSSISPDIPRLPRQLLPDSRKNIVAREESEKQLIRQRLQLEHRRQSNPKKSGREEQNQSGQNSISKHSKSTNVSSHLHDSGVVDCCSGIFNASLNGSIERQRSVDKSVQTLNFDDTTKTSPKIKSSSEKLRSNALSTWHQPLVSAIRPKSLFKPPSYPWSNEMNYLDDLLGPDIYRELPNEFRQSDSFDIPFPSPYSF